MTGWAGGSTRASRKLSREVIARDGGICQIRITGCTTIATQAHHLDGKKAGDNKDRMVAACAHCNRQIGEPKKDPPPNPRTKW